MNESVRILLIEDDEDDFVLFRRMLRDASEASYSLEWVNTFEGGLSRMQERSHDIYVLDHRLGQKTGLSLLTEAKEVAHDLPVIMLTSIGGAESMAKRAFALGAEDYLVKGEISGQLLEKALQYAIERKRLEREQKELAQRDAERNLLERRKDEFIGMVSHELKTPLTSQKMFLELLRRNLAKEGSNESRELLEKAIYQSERLERLINELLDVSKIQLGKLDLHIEPVELETLVRDLVHDMQALHPSHRFSVEGTLSYPVRADRDRITQVLINLLNNAVKYSPHGTTIAVSLMCKDPQAYIAIRDQGAGIGPEDVDRIFERFYRIERNGEPDPGGMGMGLYITSEILKSHGSRMEVESQIGKGSVFSFTLPFDTVKAHSAGS
jgi:signal transduction histidine kinase